jgi:hypothetical protein
VSLSASGPAAGGLVNARAQRHGGRLGVNSESGVPDAGVPTTTTVRSASVAHARRRRFMVRVHVQHNRDGVLVKGSAASVRKVFKFVHRADASTIGTREPIVQMARSHREFARRATPIA